MTGLLILGGMTNLQMIFVGLLLLLIIILITAIFVILRKKDKNVPDTLPPLTEMPHKDFKELIAEDIEFKTCRKKEIMVEVKKLEFEFAGIKEDLEKLEIIRKGLQ